MKIVINADDFGYDTQTNFAITEAFKLKYITSATIMANMPGFLDAVAYVKKMRLENCIGIHFNLIEGQPVSDEIKNCTLFCDVDGNFNRVRNSMFSVFHKIRKAEVEVLERELCAQIMKCREHGVDITHADSHQNIHTEWNISKVLLRVLKKEGIDKLRIARNIGKEKNSSMMKNEIKKLYKYMFNQMLIHNNIKTTDYFGSFSDLQHHYYNSSDGIIELLCHLHHNKTTLMNEEITMNECMQLLIKHSDHQEFVSYCDI